ncbi:MAG TPA: glycosyltransferase [Nitrospirota bacterium]|nr:glycosyltransferase [Nitrospirota bacterium]
MTQKINLVFMGGFTYPRGMAGTKRIQHVINSLKEYPDIATRVILQRQSAEHNILSGVHEGTPYETVMGNLVRAKVLIALPILYQRTCAALKRVLLPDHKNVLYLYGPLLLENIVPLNYAQGLGYKIVFDIIEDYDLSRDISRSIYHHVRYNFTTRLSSRINGLSAGIIVISSHLEKKYRTFTQGKVPIHYMPISVDMDCFPEQSIRMNPTVSLFYAGTFGKKDGLPVLLDAFDKLARKYMNVHMVLTGRGDREAMKDFIALMDVSPHRDRIEFKGYLEEKDYYASLNNADIPCMTRVDIAYAHAGFPFKLGEFLATGKPVIASRVSDVDRFLVNGHNAMLVQAGSSTEVCKAAEFLIDNPETAKAIGVRGRDVAKSFFDYKQQGRALVTFLENI